MMIKKYGATVLGMLLLIVLLVGAFVVPGIINRVYDSRILGQINMQEVSLSTYELTYDSFEEKLHTIGRAISEGSTINLIELSEDMSSEQTLSDEELTEVVRQEVDILLNQYLGMDISISSDELWLRRLFTVFGNSSGNTENILSGIQVYRLNYVVNAGTDKDGVILSLFMDTEFHKIYAFALENGSYYFAEPFMYRQEEISDILVDYWEIEQKHTLYNNNDEAAYWENSQKSNTVADVEETTYWENGDNWGAYADKILVFEDGVQISLRRELTVGKYGTSMNIGMDPFVYSY